MTTSRPNGYALAARVIGTASLAVALVSSTAIASFSWRSVRGKPTERKLRITGSAKKRIVSDLIEWDATVEARALDRTAAYKQLRGEVDKAVALLKKQGIRDEEIFPQSATFEEVLETVVTVSGTTRTEKQISRGYKTSEVVEVRSADVPRVERASRLITDLLEDGVAVTSAAPRYYYTKLGELKIEMLAAAGRDARARAENILKSTGGAQLGKLLGADMGIINVNPANSSETSEQGNNDNSALEKDIITIVHAEFQLE